MLARKTKGFSLDIPQVLFFFFLFFYCFYRTWLNRLVHCCRRRLWARLRKYLPRKGNRAAHVSLCVAVNRAAFLPSVSAALCDRHQDCSPGDALLCWACPPRRRIRAPPLATLGSGTSLSFGHTCFAHRWQETGDGAGRLCLHMQALGGLTHT